MTTLVNPKTREELNTTLTEQEALAICRKLTGNNFAQSLVQQYDRRGSLSPAQYFWLFKIASEHNHPEEVIELASNLEDFIAQVPTMQFRVELEDKTLGKVLLKTQPNCITVHAAYRCVGKIVKDKFHPTRKCWSAIKTQLLLFSADPMGWMQRYGRDTGYCCVCGRELTNEESVALGIGPICRNKFV